MSIFNGTPNIDLLGKRKQFGIASMVLVAFCVLLLFVPGPRYGIDFAGGTDIIVRVSTETTENDLRSALADIGFDDASVQRFGGGGEGEFLIQTRTTSTISSEKQETARAALREAFGEGTLLQFSEASSDRFFVVLPNEAFDLDGADEIGDGILDPRVFGEQGPDLAVRIDEVLLASGIADTTAGLFGNPADRRFTVRVQALQSRFEEGLRGELGEAFVRIERIETVGPRVGEQLRNDGIKSILFALIGILIYIGFRFDLRFAPGAIAALVHDVLITLGLLILLGEEINLTMVAAFLTIVGYSLNDTIVNFDRIRENLQLVGGKPKDLVGLANRSLNECLSRTLLTSMTTFIAVFCIYLVGGGLVQSFGLAMMIGVLVGTYSSIFVASPIFLATSDWMDEREAARERIAAAVSAQGPQPG